MPGRKCEPGCECSRHKRKPATEEQKARMREAQANAKGKRCEPGCTCARHKGYYRGGSKKGRTFSEEARQNIAEGALQRARDYTPEERQKASEVMKALRVSPEFEEKRLAGLRRVDQVCQEGCTCQRHSEEVSRKASEAHKGIPLTEEHKAKIGVGSRAHWARKTPEERSEIAWQRLKKYGVSRVSRHEYALAPYLAALGYLHNDDRALVVGRKFPDFYDEDNRRLFEYFGDYWHPRPEEDLETIDYYQQRGWECEVLRERDLFAWMRDHRHLLTDEQFQGTWDIANRLKPLD